jgi:hypothetical protein
LKTFRGRRSSLLCQIHLGAWRSKVPWRLEASWRSTISWAPVVGVPIAEVANTLVQWLCWMAGSHVSHLDTKTTSLRYDYGPANLVGCHGCMTFRGRCALVALPACSGHQGFYIRNEGLPVGCAPDGPAKYFWVLGRFYLETFLRSACLEWPCQTLRSHARYLDVSTLHMFEINGYIIDQSRTS